MGFRNLIVTPELHVYQALFLSVTANWKQCAAGMPQWKFGANSPAMSVMSWAANSSVSGKGRRGSQERWHDAIIGGSIAEL